MLIFRGLSSDASVVIFLRVILHMSQMPSRSDVLKPVSTCPWV
jgi:hypothetical protein